VKKYIFWSVIHNHINIALTENFTKYAQGDTFWQAMQNLSETQREMIPSPDSDESDINARLKMYHETGINKIEIFVDQEGKRFGVKCANTRSFIEAGSEQEALEKYIAAKARTSVVNTGEIK